MKEELLNYFDKIDNLLKDGNYMLFELAVVLYERCDDRRIIEQLSNKEIHKIADLVWNSNSFIDEYLSDEVDSLIGDMI